MGEFTKRTGHLRENIASVSVWNFVHFKILAAIASDQQLCPFEGMNTAFNELWRAALLAAKCKSGRQREPHRKSEMEYNVRAR